MLTIKVKEYNRMMSDDHADRAEMSDVRNFMYDFESEIFYVTLADGTELSYGSVPRSVYQAMVSYVYQDRDDLDMSELMEWHKERMTEFHRKHFLLQIMTTMG